MTKYIACRLCIATKGLKGAELGKDGISFKTEKEYIEHLKNTHGLVVKNKG